MRRATPRRQVPRSSDLGVRDRASAVVVMAQGLSTPCAANQRMQSMPRLRAEIRNQPSLVRIVRASRKA